MPAAILARPPQTRAPRQTPPCARRHRAATRACTTNSADPADSATRSTPPTPLVFGSASSRARKWALRAPRTDSQERAPKEPSVPCAERPLRASRPRATLRVLPRVARGASLCARSLRRPSVSLGARATSSAKTASLAVARCERRAARMNSCASPMMQWAPTSAGVARSTRRASARRARAIRAARDSSASGAWVTPERRSARARVTATARADRTRTAR